MKKTIFLMALVALFSSTISAQSSTTDAVSSSSEYTAKEKLLDATIICLDAVEAPTKYNEFAKQFINEPSFPKANTNKAHETLQKEINDWLAAHPAIIEQVLVERKKAHDILYGPRPY